MSIGKIQTYEYLKLCRVIDNLSTVKQWGKFVSHNSIDIVEGESPLYGKVVSGMFNLSTLSNPTELMPWAYNEMRLAILWGYRDGIHPRAHLLPIEYGDRITSLAMAYSFFEGPHVNRAMFDLSETKRHAVLVQPYIDKEKVG